MLKFTKELEGSVISIIGTGNTARGEKGKIKHATVIKVKPKNVVICILGQSTESQLRKHENVEDYSHHLIDGFNGGYACYYSDSDIAKERHLEAKLRKISDIINTYGANNPEKRIQAIKDVLSECEE